MSYQHLIQRFNAGLTAFFVVMCIFALVAIPAELDSRCSIASSRSPVYVSTEANASFAYRVDNTFINSRLVGVLELEPLGDDAELPAGLTQWLEPGHIAVSRAAKQYSDILESQFGPIQSVIDDAVILDGEVVVYYRPSNGKAFIDLAKDEDGVYFSSGFAKNAREGALFGDVNYEQWSQYLLPVTFLVFALPLILNLRATRASVGKLLSGERFVLESIGAPRRQLIRHSIAYLYKPYLVGVGLAAVVIAVLVSGYVRLPFTGYRLHPRIYLDILALLVVYLVLVTGVAFAYLVWPSTSRTRAQMGETVVFRYRFRACIIWAGNRAGNCDGSVLAKDSKRSCASSCVVHSFIGDFGATCNPCGAVYSHDESRGEKTKYRSANQCIFSLGDQSSL
ncbi:hypothetical protein [Arcanobacterium phocae]|uniref:hypothetical protein n=1 Tax=Arcanobacterium phocae TaxID=131112 RepID=UPI001C110F99|nr:hypothetical protein [Arcanobacterium phocae]